ncbi:MAG: hypothetical protein WDN47_03420 [Candidatus Doudnabacteria bacterium]
MQFNGLKPPAGPGLVIEVHADLIQPSHDFSSFLRSCGFEDDPFSIFFPREYTDHMTGRIRVQKSDLPPVVADVRRTVETILAAAGNEPGVYMEIELVKDKVSFPAPISDQTMYEILESFNFSSTGRCGEAKADIHVKFLQGQVLPEVREYLVRKHFYWVATPPNEHIGAKEICTLQTDTYESAQAVFAALCQHPLPNCIGLHLEQKLGMVPNRANLPMPEVIAVKKIR